MEKTKERGVTLLETVIAMALAVIISVAAYMTCDFAIKNQKNIETKNFFTQEIENVSMCYYKSDNDVTKFENIMLFTLNIENTADYFEYTSTVDENEIETLIKLTIYYDENLSLITKINKTKAKYKVVFDYSNFKLYALNISKNKVVFERQV